MLQSSYYKTSLSPPQHRAEGCRRTYLLGILKTRDSQEKCRDRGSLCSSECQHGRRRLNIVHAHWCSWVDLAPAKPVCWRLRAETVCVNLEQIACVETFADSRACTRRVHFLRDICPWTYDILSPITPKIIRDATRPRQSLPPRCSPASAPHLLSVQTLTHQHISSHRGCVAAPHPLSVYYRLSSWYLYRRISSYHITRNKSQRAFMQTCRMKNRMSVASVPPGATQACALRPLHN